MQYILYHLFLSWGIQSTLAVTLSIISILIVLSILSYIGIRIAHILLKRFILTLIRHYWQTRLASSFEQLKIINKCSHLIPSCLFLFASPLLTFTKHPWTLHLTVTVVNIALLFLLFNSLKLIFACLDIFTIWYQGLKLLNKQPIRSYVQFIKITLSILAIILSVSIVIDKSPFALLTGIGALSAVLLLVFKDTITGFVSSIQVSAQDLVRVGDWITIPQFHADGDVIEISINTVKIRNFDQTIITIPTQSLVTSGVQNWRGMRDSGGRRIKRSLNIDIDTIKFCPPAMLTEIKKIDILKDKIASHEKVILRHNEENKTENNHQLNQRQFTNVGLFRYYIEAYLRSLSTINFSLTFMVRQLEPNATGLPIQIYVFTNDTNWVRYEAIQADIFDHLLAATRLFELEVLQIKYNQKPAPSGFVT